MPYHLFRFVFILETRCWYFCFGQKNQFKLKLIFLCNFVIANNSEKDSLCNKYEFHWSRCGNWKCQGWTGFFQRFVHFAHGILFQVKKLVHFFSINLF